MHFVSVSILFVALVCKVSPSVVSPMECNDPLKEYRSCQSSSCVKTCENPNPQVCTLDCRQGCYCKDPYVLDKFSNRCVRIENCKELCRKNEEYKTCGYCDSTCKGENTRCTRNCRPGCYCKKGFVRNNGVCIDASRC